MIPITIPMWIAASPVIFAGLLIMLRNRFIKPKNKTRFKHCEGGISKTTYPDERAKDFNTWILFLTWKYDLKWNPTPNFNTKDTQRISLRSK